MQAPTFRSASDLKDLHQNSKWKERKSKQEFDLPQLPPHSGQQAASFQGVKDEPFNPPKEDTFALPVKVDGDTHAPQETMVFLCAAAAVNRNLEDLLLRGGGAGKSVGMRDGEAELKRVDTEKSVRGNRTVGPLPNCQEAAAWSDLNTDLTD